MSGGELSILSGEQFDEIVPESPWDFSGFAKLLDAIDDKCRRQEAVLAGQIACKAGCHHCCRRIPSILPVEWAWMRQAESRAAKDRPLRAGLVSDLHPGEPLCDHLDEQGLCRIYAVRPLICRTHGMLILSEQGLDHCPWNFADLEEVDDELVFRLENLHETLLRLNLAFLRHSYPSRYGQMAAMRVEFQA